jgi:hypothetical protein
MINSMALRNKTFKKIFAQWPVALIVIGFVFTIAWVILLIWLPLRLLEIV